MKRPLLSRARMLSVLLALSLGLVLAMPALGQGDASRAPEAEANQAAKKKKKKKQNCRASSRRSSSAAKSKKKKRCPAKKKAAPKKQADSKPGGTTPGTTGTPPQGTPPAAPQGATTGPAAIEEFAGYLAGSSLYRVYANTTTNSSTQGNDRYNFCSARNGASGTFNYYGEYIGHVSSSTTRYSGTWEVKEAAIAPDKSRAQARVAYTTDSADNPPGEVVITFVGSNQAYMGETEYQRQPGNAGC